MPTEPLSRRFNDPATPPRPAFPSFYPVDRALGDRMLVSYYSEPLNTRITV